MADSDGIQIFNGVPKYNKNVFIAEKVANNPFALTTLKGFNGDFQFIKQELDIFGAVQQPRVSSRTKTFLKTIIDPEFLGVLNTSVYDAVNNTAAGSQENARNSLDAINIGLFELQRCFSLIKNLVVYTHLRDSFDFSELSLFLHLTY